MSELARVDSGGYHSAIDEEQLVTMKVDGQLFGIPILNVQDIVEPQQITPVPLAPTAIAGVLNLRGRIVTVIDLRECLGSQPIERERMMSVTVEHKGDLYTLLVDSIGDVRSLPRRDFDKPPMTLESRMRKLCSGIYRLEHDLLAVLDVERVLAEDTIESTPKRRPRRKKQPKAEASVAALPSPVANDGAGSLFERLGGEAGIDAAVDLFYERVLGDGRLKPFFSGVDMAHQLKSMKAFLTTAFGGPAIYRGPDLRSAHQRLVHEKGLDGGHFLTVAGHLSDTLIQMGVPDDLIDEVMTLVGGVKDDVLNE